jgi:hypothetical protein
MRLIITIFLGVGLIADVCLALDPLRGKYLFENHCQTCHHPYLLEREHRKVRDVAALQYQTRRWQAEIGVAWSEEEVSDVIDYLNERFYHFAELPERD